MVQIKKRDPWVIVPVTVDTERPSLITTQTLGAIALDDDELFPDDTFRPGREPIRRQHRAMKWQLHDDAHGGRLLPEVHRRGISPSPTHFFDDVDEGERANAVNAESNGDKGKSKSKERAG